MTVQQVYDFINARAPYETQAPYDNSGLLVGDPSAPVQGVHFAMDLTQPVIDEAIASGANLIVTHHPIMFSPIKRLVTTDYESRLIMRLVRHGIAMISAHTNLDQAPGGINDVLAQRLGLTGITGEGFLRMGELPRPMSASELAAHVSQALNTTVRTMGSGENITRLAMCSGGGSDEWRAARDMGAQAFLSGEIKHHHALEAADSGILCLEAGHHATEEPGIFALADALQNELNAVQCNVHVSTSRLAAYAAPGRP
ncbi:MAG: Nif3-like dinuclear metal center hexameric protein [Clostridia bacterium]|nr:Nif3-like dinuclear metal center hexameric protein [Clostridia bacterium]